MIIYKQSHIEPFDKDTMSWFTMADKLNEVIEAYNNHIHVHGVNGVKDGFPTTSLPALFPLDVRQNIPTNDPQN